METIIEVENLTHIYREGEDRQIEALTEINLEVAEGEFVVIIGPNGSGKSTLAKHFNALILPSSGRVLIDGLDTREDQNIWEIRRKVGMVFQNPDNQLVATVVEEDVAFGPENLGLEPSVIHNRIAEALRVVDMEEYRDRAPHLLSGGQKQKVAIAGIIAMRPQCIVLDEPTAMLDPAGRRDVIGTIRRLNRKEGVTVVHITHFMDEAIDCDRVIVMSEGRVVMEGSPGEVFGQVQRIKAYGLEVPQMTELAHRLNKKGFKLRQDTLGVEEMVMQLCP